MRRFLEDAAGEREDRRLVDLRERDLDRLTAALERPGARCCIERGGVAAFGDAA